MRPRRLLELIRSLPAESQEYFAEGQQADLLVEYLDDFYEAIKSDLHSANILEIDPSTGRPVPAGP